MAPRPGSRPRGARSPALVGLSLAWALGCTSRAPPAPQGEPAAAKVVLFEGFDGPALDPRWVTLDRAGDYSNAEQQCYRPSQVTVAGGNLSIVTQIAPATCGDAVHPPGAFPSVSGMVQLRSLQFTYGTVEVRARLAGGRGSWSAIWLLGADCQASNLAAADGVPPCNWPRPGSDEIDIAETINSNVSQVNQQLHTAASNAGCRPSVADTSASFHVYQLTWAPNFAQWRIDGAVTCTVTSGVPTTPMFLILNTAVGGAGGPVDPSSFPQRMEVDSIRITQP